MAKRKLVHQTVLVLEFVRRFPQARLTGSRFFGNSVLYSDWDFYMPMSVAKQQMGVLEAMDFKPLKREATQYNDRLVAEVWTNKNNIHLQLIEDDFVYVKDSAQALLDGLPQPLRHTLLESSGVSRTLIWNWAIELVGPEGEVE